MPDNSVCPRRRTSLRTRARPACTRPPAARPAGMVATGSLLATALVLGAGCAAWRGDLDPVHDRYVRQRVADVAQADLRAQAQELPKSIETDLDSVRPRRATGTTQFG